MLAKLRSRLSYSNVIATMALFIALGGGAYAAATLPKNSVGTKQLKSNAVTSSKVKNRSLLARDFKSGQLPRGPRGFRGATGSVDMSKVYDKTASDQRFLRRYTSGIVDVPKGGSDTTLLTHGPLTFSARCTSKGGDPEEFEIAIDAKSTAAGTWLGRDADNFEIGTTPTEIVASKWGTAMVRHFSAAVIAEGGMVNVLVTRGVKVAGHDCIAGVTVLP